MSRKRFSYKDVPGWLVMVLLFGILYATGLHTEAIGQVQRLLLATGIKNADVPALEDRGSGTGSTSSLTAMDTGFALADLDGKPVTLASMKGKVVFLNVWATWCPPCLAEMPGIQNLYEAVGSDKIAFVMLSVDREGAEKVKKFIEKKQYTFPVYTPLGRFPAAFESNAIPATYILSPEGEIVFREEGMANYDTEKMRSFLKNLAAR